MISEKDIQHIAKLARIELDAKTQEKMKKDLSSILGYVEQLNSVNTEGVEPLYQTTGLMNQMRADKHRKPGEGSPSLTRGIASDFVMDEKLNELIIGQAPHKEERFIKVKAVLKK